MSIKYRVLAAVSSQASGWQSFGDSVAQSFSASLLGCECLSLTTTLPTSVCARVWVTRAF